ncbi:MAG TPA: nucleotide sugar dehydrogenase [Acidobacteriaceae bacterium]
MKTLDNLTLPTPAEKQLQKIESKEAKIGVIGLGYVGLPLSLLLCEAGFAVKGFDIDEKKVAKLENGSSYIFRIPETDILLARERGFRATVDFEEISSQDVIILCVPTPLTSHREPDLSFIKRTAEAIAPWLRANQLVVLESTSYPGTTEEVLIPILNAGNHGSLSASCNDKPMDDNVFYVAFSPEREDPGNNTVARCDIPKVVGGHDVVASRLASSLYGSIFNRTVNVSSTQAAEMTKLLENIYRCVNIALVNELKILSLRMGIDIWEVIAAASTKPFGFQAFYPGPGLGGHCIPIDPFYLSWKARESDFHTRFIELAGEINEGMPRFVVQSVSEALNKQRKALNGSKILVLGVAYKRDIDDLRESPSLEIIELLKKEQACVDYNDPYFPVVGRGRHYDLGMECTALDKIPEYDCVLIVTDHSDYDYAAIVDAATLVVDTRNATRGIQSSKIVHC